MKSVKRSSRAGRRGRFDALPLQPLYPMSELAHAMGISHRKLQMLLETEDVRVLRAGRFLFVPLTELEAKVPTLWESIRAVETLHRALEEV